MDGCYEERKLGDDVVLAGQSGQQGFGGGGKLYTGVSKWIGLPAKATHGLVASEHSSRAGLVEGLVGLLGCQKDELIVRKRLTTSWAFCAVVTVA
jgi:hypothetical protein